MNIAFYAPLKSPNDPVPSGDRQIARNLISALEQADHEIVLTSECRTYEGAGNIERQNELKADAQQQAKTLVTDYRRSDHRKPDAWVTYHVYHKAPDWIGPIVTAALGIPYVIVEASISPKQENGKWRDGHAAAITAVGAADLVLGLNPRDAECVVPFMKPSALYQSLAPFIDTQPFRQATSTRTKQRHTFAETHGLDQSRIWLLTVGMMRDGDKYKSYQVLASTLDQITDLDWHLVCVGDGEVREKVASVLSPHSHRITWLGARRSEELPFIYAACDIFAWPAINEALGMVFLEAGAAGLPCVAGHTDGVASIVKDCETGLISARADAKEFAHLLRKIILDQKLRRKLGQNAYNHINTAHSLKTIGKSLGRLIAATECEMTS